MTIPIRILSSVILALIISACGTTPESTPQASSSSIEVNKLKQQLSGTKQQLSGTQQKLTKTEEKNSMLNSAIGRLQGTVSGLRGTVSNREMKIMELEAMQGTMVTPMSGADDLLPPHAKAGECYARVLISPTYKTVSKTVLSREAGERVVVTPAKFEWAEERVMVQPASEKLVTEPPVYKSVTDKVLVREGYTTWKKGRGPIEKINDATGEIMCLVEVPPVYRTVKTKVLDRPARTRAIAIPAQYKTVRVKRLVQPAQERRIAIPEKHQTVSDRIKVSDGRIEWRSILCETNTTPGLVTRLQRALDAAGHSPGPIDGVIGTRTIAAAKAYQRKKGLAVGQLTTETLKSLKVR